MLLDWIVFDRFDTFSAQSNVSFELPIFLKMALIVIWDRSENKDELESKKTIEVCTNKYQNYDLISSFYDYCARLICKITKNYLLLIIHSSR